MKDMKALSRFFVSNKGTVNSVRVNPLDHLPGANLNTASAPPKGVSNPGVVRSASQPSPDPESFTATLKRLGAKMSNFDYNAREIHVGFSTAESFHAALGSELKRHNGLFGPVKRSDSREEAKTEEGGLSGALRAQEPVSGSPLISSSEEKFDPNSPKIVFEGISGVSEERLRELQKAVEVFEPFIKEMVRSPRGQLHVVCQPSLAEQKAQGPAGQVAASIFGREAPSASSHLGPTPQDMAHYGQAATGAATVVSVASNKEVKSTVTQVLKGIVKAIGSVSGDSSDGGDDIVSSPPEVKVPGADQDRPKSWFPCGR